MNDPIGSNGTGCWRMGCDHITLSVDVGYVHVQSPLGWLQEFYLLDMDRHCCIIST